MKKIILFLSLFLSGFTYAQTQNQIETKLSDKSKLYKEHKKQLIENEKKYQDERRLKNIKSDVDEQSKLNGEVVDFSTGKPVKK